jgi:hypothetical protein
LGGEAQIETLLYPVDDCGFTSHSAVDWFLERAASCGDLVIRNSSITSTTVELRGMAIETRYQEIGEVNQQILSVIFRSNPKQVEHIHLLNFEIIHQGESQKVLFGLTTDELIYRVFYLVAIGMLEEIKDRNKNRIYRLTKETEDWMSKDSQEKRPKPKLKKIVKI